MKSSFLVRQRSRNVEECFEFRSVWMASVIAALCGPTLPFSRNPRQFFFFRHRISTSSSIRPLYLQNGNVYIFVRLINYFRVSLDVGKRKRSTGTEKIMIIYEISWATVFG